MSDSLAVLDEVGLERKVGKRIMMIETYVALLAEGFEGVKCRRHRIGDDD